MFYEHWGWAQYYVFCIQALGLVVGVYDFKNCLQYGEKQDVIESSLTLILIMSVMFALKYGGFY